jgi:hypothetical protein
MHLITSVGLGNYKELNYCFGSNKCRTSFAPVAVARLINMKGARASVLVTREARDMYYERVAAELIAAGLNPRPLDIPGGGSEEDILEILAIITSEVNEGDSVVLDVTFSLRHLPFIYLAALIYLVGLKKVKLKGIFYGAFDLKQGEDAPIIEITYLYQLIEWYRGLTNARQEGDFRPLGKLLKSDVGRLFKSGIENKKLARISRLAGDLAFSLASVLPLEVGMKAGNILTLLKNLELSTGSALTSILALDSLGRSLGDWQVPESQVSGLNKEGIELGKEELNRQLALAEWYVGRMNLPAALLVLREWMITRLQFAAGHCSSWLGYSCRKPYEKTLNAINERARHSLGNQLEKDLASTWGRISRLRNQFAHAGMDSDEVRVSPDEVRNVLQECKKLMEIDIPSSIPARSDNVCLVSPLGLSRGVLYSALKLFNPDRLVVVTSPEASQSIPEILEVAGYNGLDLMVIKLADPHSGFDEAKDIAANNDNLIKSLAMAGKVVVNITGGTTAMQYAVERIAGEASKLGTSVKKVALVDKRPYEEQRVKPYVCGEIVVLDEGN